MTVQQSAAIVTTALQITHAFRRQNPQGTAEQAVRHALDKLWRQYTPESQKAAERAIRGLYASTPAVKVVEVPAPPQPVAVKKAVTLSRVGDGVYKTQDGKYEVQNPHKMSAGDPDRKWYVVRTASSTTESGPFDTLKDVRDYLAAHG